MSREDIHKLLGGYATGTLTAEEREELFAAALEDQELFDALMREQPLAGLLSEPAARAQLIAALEDRPAPWYRVWWRPALAVGAMAAVAILAVVAVRETPPAPHSVEVAEVKPAQANLRVFHPPPPAAPQPKAAVIAPPPAVIVPRLEKPSLPFPAPLPPPPAAETASAAPKGAFAPNPAEARSMARLSADSMMLGAAVPVRYTILRKQPDGEFAAAGPRGLEKGDLLELRVESDQSGDLAVTAVDDAGQSHEVASGSVSQAAAFTTPVLPAGVTNLRITFTRRDAGANSPPLLSSRCRSR